MPGRNLSRQTSSSCVIRESAAQITSLCSNSIEILTLTYDADSIFNKLAEDERSGAREDSTELCCSFPV